MALALAVAVTMLLGARWRPTVLLASGILAGQRQVLGSVGVLELLGRQGREYTTTPEAIRGARDHLEAAGLLRPVPAVPAGADSVGSPAAGEDGPHG